MTLATQVGPGALIAAPRVAAVAGFRRRHRLVYIAVATMALAASAMGLETSHAGSWWMIAALVVLVLGVPHGAFDVALASRRWDLTSSWKRLGFLAGYVALAATVGGVWYLVPGPALVVFIIVSAFHFAGDWSDVVPRVLPRAVFGLALLCAPALLHSAAVIEIFVLLAPARAAATVAEMMGWFALLALPAGLVVIASAQHIDRIAAVEMAMTLLLATFADPLVFFVVYFCGLHAIRHLQSTYDELRPPSLAAFARLSLPYAPLAMAGIVIGAGLLTAVAPSSALLGAVFLGLAALTAPHMVLVEWPAQRC